MAESGHRDEEQRQDAGEDRATPEDKDQGEQPAAEKAESAEEPQTQPADATEDGGAAEQEVPEEPEGEAEASEGPRAEAEGKASKESQSEDEKRPPGAELEPITIEPQRELSAEERARLEAEAEERARAEAAATAESGEEPVPAREPAVELPAEARIQATGKRKTSVARVILVAGRGDFLINRRRLEEYFPRHQHQTFVRQPLLTSGYEGKVDVRVRVHGGGISGQAGAVRHGIARALTEVDPELRGELKRRGLLTRDARAKERRKAGLKKARKRPQFSKR
jgi:small subunit ribosomal protein S9